MAKQEAPNQLAQRREVNDLTLRQFAGYNLKRAYMTIADDLHHILNGHELRVTTFSALALIGDNPDFAQGELAQALHIERSSVVVVVDDLESRDLITRNKVPGDRRTYALRITLTGRRLLNRLQKEIAAHESRLFADLTKEERATLVNLLNRIEGGGVGSDGRTV